MAPRPMPDVAPAKTAVRFAGGGKDEFVSRISAREGMGVVEDCAESWRERLARCLVDGEMCFAMDL